MANSVERKLLYHPSADPSSSPRAKRCELDVWVKIQKKFGRV